MSLKGIIKGYGNAALNKAGVGNPALAKLAKVRMDVCESCETYDPPTTVCLTSKGGCGCNMEKKVFWKEAKCPKNKWK